MTGPTPVWGWLAEFATADELLAATRRARAAGYARVEAYAPFPVEGLADALGFRPSRVPLATFVGGCVGGIGGFLLQWYSAVVAYPFNVAGRPLNSWPMFVPVTFELTVLCAALAAFGTAIVGNGLPRLRHPVFGAADFDLAMRNRFFLGLRADDPQYDVAATPAFIDALQPLKRIEVPA